LTSRAREVREREMFLGASRTNKGERVPLTIPLIKTDKQFPWSQNDLQKKERERERGDLLATLPELRH
jgi:hypothetical protein